MNHSTKKHTIIALLLAACLASVFLLVHSSASTPKPLINLAQADSLLQERLEAFDIAEEHTGKYTVQLDSVNRRSVYRIKVPPAFSKTELHRDIHQTFLEYGVSSPARVLFPERDMVIYLLANSTVFSTIRLQSDPELAPKPGETEAEAFIQTVENAAPTPLADVERPDADLVTATLRSTRSELYFQATD